MAQSHIYLYTDVELPDEDDYDDQEDYDYDQGDYDYDYEYDEMDHCLDHDQLVLLCGGRNCIREPSPREDCLQCINDCNGQ